MIEGVLIDKVDMLNSARFQRRYHNDNPFRHWQNFDKDIDIITSSIFRIN